MSQDGAWEWGKDEPGRAGLLMKYWMAFLLMKTKEIQMITPTVSACFTNTKEKKSEKNFKG